MENTQIGKEGLIEKLRAMQFAETAKPADRMDTSLVDLLTDMLLDLDGESPIEQAEHDVGIRSILDRISTPSTQASHKRTWRKLLIAAIIAALIFAAGLVYITLGSQGNPDQFKWAHYIVEHLLLGDSLNTNNGVTIYNYGATKHYNSVEECLREEKYDILYPSFLPSGAHIVSIRVLRDLTFDKTRILYVTDLPDTVSVTVTMDCSMTLESKKYAFRSEKINGITCYFYYESAWCQCQFSKDRNLYTIEASSFSDVKQIIQNMKGSIASETIKKSD